ncbi:glycosyltransferase family 8 protein [Sphingobacterium sp. UT-1RO-CII-1]|uniref:glycosyltransferase family 8 protein n=1 Tax=Sphingobacterium sp. UT-1RO-CII-1 TaxID=2995225 RepID=UPI00227D5113|nr:glycosyltransferase family 8 protein [Sphingobacterium sp. UT-1RO-CII-1]MCY4778536.1 glycosyltransferase family 8 protein [Sphingobacterium sp. UT-1RO-CII-1]
MMITIPLVFCFDDNWLLAAGVCLTSLLENAKKDTFYDVFILHATDATFQKSGTLEKLTSIYDNFKLSYRSVGSQFKEGFEIRGITNSTYFRLLIPEVVPEYDKIMYHDVDVIFQDDLSEIFLKTDMSNSYVAGVVSPGGLVKHTREKREKLGLNWKEYILAGNIIMNAKMMRNDGIVDLFKKEVATSQYEYQDMDILNIVCKGKIKTLSPVFCGTIEVFKLAAKKENQPLYALSELGKIHNKGVIHYNGPKPWDGWCPNFDIWWEYYRRSVFFDPTYYFDFYTSKYDELDRLGEAKLMKLLLRRIAKRLNVLKIKK